MRSGIIKTNRSSMSRLHLCRTQTVVRLVSLLAILTAMVRRKSTFSISTSSVGSVKYLTGFTDETRENGRTSSKLQPILVPSISYLDAQWPVSTEMEMDGMAFSSPIMVVQ